MCDEGVLFLLIGVINLYEFMFFFWVDYEVVGGVVVFLLEVVFVFVMEYGFDVVLMYEFEFLI